jgi:hypothetical protein
MGSDLVYSILSQNGTLTRPASTRFVIGLLVARLFRGIDLCRSESMERLDLWREAGSDGFQSQHTNVGCLGLSRSQVTPGVVNVHAGYGRYVKSTYIHHILRKFRH